MKKDEIELLEKFTKEFSGIKEIQAIALAGSRTNGEKDSKSDFDIYIYSEKEISVAKRKEIAEKFTFAVINGEKVKKEMEINNQFWETGDEWIDAESGICFDIMFRTPGWIEEQIERTIERCEAWVGYTTCFWDNVINSEILFDRDGWFTKLQKRAKVDFPEKLAVNIVAKNYPILKNTISSYVHQIEKAVERKDLISINHRIAALLASYFDILFAVNKVTNPGEKRLIQIALKKCKKLPENFEEDVNGLILEISHSVNGGKLIEYVKKMLNRFDEFLVEEGYLYGN